jgi:hypothetical protein
MNVDKTSALLHYMGQIRRRIGRELQPAARFVRHGQVRNDPKKPSGAARRHALRWGGSYRFDDKAKVWRLQPAPGSFVERFKRMFGHSEPLRTARGKLSNPTALR